MSTLRDWLAVSTLALALAACSSESGKTHYDAGVEPEPEPEQDAEAEPDEDAETDADAGASVGPVPLTVWVDDLIDNHTTDDAEPDTVDDKIITDDTDESSFDKYLP